MILARRFTSPPARDVPRILDLLLSLAPRLPEEERSRLWRTAEWLFSWNTGRAEESSFSINEMRSEQKGLIVGPYPDTETYVRRMLEDLAAGRLVFLDPGEGPGVFDRPTRLLEFYLQRAISGVVLPALETPADPDSPVFIAAEWSEGGLDITLSNRGEVPFLVNPLITRYAEATLSTVTCHGGGEEKVYSKLTLDLGAIGARTAIPRQVLVRIDPGKSFSWTQAIREEHRDVDHIVVKISPWWTVLGGTEIPYLRELKGTWIR